MTKEQFLLLKLAEECMEVAQRASKQIQFGKEEIQKGQLSTNAERLKGELLDLFVIVKMLEETDQISTIAYDEFEQAYKDKKQKLQKYLDLSKTLNQLPVIQL